MNRRHADPPLDVAGDDGRRAVARSDASNSSSDEVVVDLRDDAAVDSSSAAPGPSTLTIAIDVSLTLDRMSDVCGLDGGHHRLTVGLISALDSMDTVELQLLDGRAGRLRLLSPSHRQSFVDCSPRGRWPLARPTGRRMIGAGLRTRRWRPPPGSWFLDLEPAWLGSMSRTTLLPALQANGVRISAYVPDLDPLRHPERFAQPTITGFRQWLRAHRNAASTWLATSPVTADHLVHWLGPRSKNHDVKLLGPAASDEATDRAATPIDWAENSVGLVRHLRHVESRLRPTAMRA